MKKQAKPEHFFHKPRYPGGRKAMDAFIRENMVYPEEALKSQVQGIVSLKFDIDEFGQVSHVQIIHALGFGCDEEAIRLVKLLQFEKTKKAGIHVTFHQSLNIHFRLPQPTPIPSGSLNIQYEIKPAVKETPAPTTPGYGYSIRLDA